MASRLADLGPALAFTLAAAAGYAYGPAGRALAARALQPLLIALAVAVGGYMAAHTEETIRAARRLHLPALLAASTLVGGALAGAAAAPLAGMDLGASIAVAVGSGWYSFTGSYLAIYDPLLGLLGFASNLIREAVVLAGYPLLARLAGPLPAVAAGGATTMDTTLPVIARSAGPRTAAIALVHGTLITLAVPLLLPLAYP